MKNWRKIRIIHWWCTYKWVLECTCHFMLFGVFALLVFCPNFSLWKAHLWPTGRSQASLRRVIRLYQFAGAKLPNHWRSKRREDQGDQRRSVSLESWSLWIAAKVKRRTKKAKMLRQMSQCSNTKMGCHWTLERRNDCTPSTTRDESWLTWTSTRCLKLVGSMEFLGQLSTVGWSLDFLTVKWQSVV